MSSRPESGETNTTASGGRTAARPAPSQGPPARHRRRWRRSTPCSATGRGRRDLLIEHLHLIQDRYHCLSAPHLAALAEEMTAAAGRGLRGRHLLRPFRCRSRRRPGAGIDRPRLRQPELRVDGRRGPARRPRRAAWRRRRACRARALHGPLRECARPSRSATATSTEPRRHVSRSRRGRRPRTGRPALCLVRRLCGGRRLWPPAGSASKDSRTMSRLSSDRAERLGPARPGRRGLPDRHEVGVRPQGGGAAADGGQRRRGRARHLQGPPLSGEPIRTASSRAR